MMPTEPDWRPLIAAAVFEACALIAIYRVWRKKSKSLPAKIFWTLVLLVPLLGLLLYAFIFVSPDSHDDNPPMNTSGFAE